MTIGQSGDILLADSKQVKHADSDIELLFSNGPTQDEDVKGLFTLSFSYTGSGVISNIEIDISSDGTNWIPVENLTTTPWLTHIDTTDYANGSWTFRARAWDSTANNHTTWFTSGEFDIVNQVPIITTFALSNNGVGTGTSAIDRAWYSLEANGCLLYTSDAADE